MIPLRRTRTEKPNYPVGIDWSNPLSKGLRKVWILDQNQPIEMVDRNTRCAPFNASLAAGKYGRYTDFGSGSDGYLNTNLSTQDFRPSEITITSRCRIESGTTASFVVSADFNGTSVPFQLAGYVLGTSTRGISFFDGAWHSSGELDIRGTGWRIMSGVYTNANVSDNLRLYLDGALDSSADVSGNPSLPAHSGTFKDINIGRYKNDNTTFGGDIEFVFIHDRPLSAAEIKSLHDNPYQILQPRTQIYTVAVAQAGITVPRRRMIMRGAA